MVSTQSLDHTCLAMSAVLLRRSRTCMHRADLPVESRIKSLIASDRSDFAAECCCAVTPFASSRTYEGGTVGLEGWSFRESMVFRLEGIS